MPSPISKIGDGKGLGAAYEGLDGAVTMIAAQEDGRRDHSAELGALASAGGDALLMIGHGDHGREGILRGGLDAGALETFLGADGMVSEVITGDLGAQADGHAGMVPWSEGPGAKALATMAREAGIEPDSPRTRESYDAAAPMALAVLEAGGSDGATVAAALPDVADAPGEPVPPGGLAQAARILPEGGEVDHAGATDVELSGPGEASGTRREHVVEHGAYETVGSH